MLAIPRELSLAVPLPGKSVKFLPPLRVLLSPASGLRDESFSL
jgi:hypothetical protein